MKKSRVTAAVLFTILFALLATRIAGALLAPVLERTLTRVFGMAVYIETLRINPFTGRVHAEKVRFLNQPGFTDGPHLFTETLDFTIDLPALSRRQVIIRTAAFNEVFYSIERRELAGAKITNVQTWVRNIKSRRKKKALDSSLTEKKKKPWLVKIEHIVIHNGTFIYDDRTQQGTTNRFVFQKLKGKLSGFRYPAKPQTHLEQKVEIEGLMGEVKAEPVKVWGYANFSGGEVSFDLTGKAHGGYMENYTRFWSEMPIALKKGRFNLDIRMICIRKYVRSRALLLLYDLRIAPSPKVTELVWGIPVSSALGFLQNKKEISLHIPVSGKISDPQFDFYKAFQRAFQEAFLNKLKRGLNLFVGAPVRIVTQTKDVVVQTQETLVSGLGKITSIVTNTETKNE